MNDNIPFSSTFDPSSRQDLKIDVNGLLKKCIEGKNITALFENEIQKQLLDPLFKNLNSAIQKISVDIKDINFNNLLKDSISNIKIDTSAINTLNAAFSSKINSIATSINSIGIQGIQNTFENAVKKQLQTNASQLNIKPTATASRPNIEDITTPFSFTNKLPDRYESLVKEALEKLQANISSMNFKISKDINTSDLFKTLFHTTFQSNFITNIKYNSLVSSLLDKLKTGIEDLKINVGDTLSAKQLLGLLMHNTPEMNFISRYRYSKIIDKAIDILSDGVSQLEFDKTQKLNNKDIISILFDKTADTTRLIRSKYLDAVESVLKKFISADILEDDGNRFTSKENKDSADNEADYGTNQEGNVFVHKTVSLSDETIDRLINGFNKNKTNTENSTDKTPTDNDITETLKPLIDQNNKTGGLLSTLTELVTGYLVFKAAQNTKLGQGVTRALRQAASKLKSSKVPRLPASSSTKVIETEAKVIKNASATPKNLPKSTKPFSSKPITLAPEAKPTAVSEAAKDIAKAPKTALLEETSVLRPSNYAMLGKMLNVAAFLADTTEAGDAEYYLTLKEIEKIADKKTKEEELKRRRMRPGGAESFELLNNTKYSDVLDTVKNADVGLGEDYEKLKALVDTDRSWWRGKQTINEAFGEAYDKIYAEMKNKSPEDQENSKQKINELTELKKSFIDAIDRSMSKREEMYRSDKALPETPQEIKTKNTTELPLPTAPEQKPDFNSLFPVTDNSTNIAPNIIAETAFNKEDGVDRLIKFLSDHFVDFKKIAAATDSGSKAYIVNNPSAPDTSMYFNNSNQNQNNSISLAGGISRTRADIRVS